MLSLRGTHAIERRRVVPMTLPHESRQYATGEEVHNVIQHLQDSDFVKLMIIARSFTKRRLYGALVGAEDLLQEAIAKTLAGRRRWNRDVSIVRHLDRVMESDSSHLAERRAQEAQRVREHMPPLDVHAATVPHELSPEYRLQVCETLDNVVAFFADDERALQLIHLKGKDFSASEIQRKLGMSKTEYDTVTKRIRRRIANISVE